MIYRPRDVLQFFIEAQKEFVKERPLTEEKVQTALERYSDEYFVDAMSDELTGFFPDEAVTLLPDILSEMDSRYFFPEEFAEQCAKCSAFKDVSTNLILEKLFQAGYIGQYRPREKDDYTVFSYRNTREKFQAEHECILHRGLVRGLTL